jgi:hypothetical protein
MEDQEFKAIAMLGGKHVESLSKMGAALFVVLES